jgi:thiol-disulfide isomerase/thioredoxin
MPAFHFGARTAPAVLQSPHFILYSRSYCHLCDDMLLALQALPQAAGLAIDVVDVDADDALLHAYDELVPVLIGVGVDGARRKLCHYFLDPQAVSAFLTM